MAGMVAKAATPRRPAMAVARHMAPPAPEEACAARAMVAAAAAAAQPVAYTTASAADTARTATVPVPRQARSQPMGPVKWSTTARTRPRTATRAALCVE